MIEFNLKFLDTWPKKKFRGRFYYSYYIIIKILYLKWVSVYSTSKDFDS